MSQKFHVSHLDEKDFKAEGLRNYALYRDLGLVEATQGLARAHVIRLKPPYTSEAALLHYHEVNFQMIYVLQGWIKNSFEGEGVKLMQRGSCWLQPPGIKHSVLDYSDDVELLEVILPADFKTVTLESPDK
ncbi:MAG: cupin domain-containing protein [Burkholderiales bacterium]